MAEGNGLDIGSLYGLMVKIGEAVSRQEVTLQRIEDRLDRLERRMDALERRMDALERRMDALEEQLTRLRLDVAAEFADIRQTINAYHASVVGHGIALSELEGRMRRVEDHLNLPPFVHG